jgi:radical SAM superfamily enzyme YgiQ (UPF0313 family)
MVNTNKGIKVVLIQPPDPWGANAVIPQSLMELAAILQSALMPVEILDARLDNLTVAQTMGVLKKRAFDVVGITGLNCSYRFIKAFCFAFKREFPDKPLMAGGHFIMHLPEIILRSVPIDVACTREADDIIVDLVGRMVRRAPLDGLSNIAYLKDGEFVKTEYRLVEDLDRIPFPAYDLLDMERYVRALNGGAFPLTTGRGCVNHCYYCSNPYQKVRKISPRNIVRHFDLLNDKYGVRSFAFSEENSFHPPFWLMGICDILNELGREYDLTVAGCANHVTDELVSKLSSIKGKVSVEVAVEHWNPEIQRGFNRGHISSHIEEAWDLFKKYNIPIGSFTILWGHPKDTVKSFKEALKKSLGMQKKYNIESFALRGLMLFANSRFLKDAQGRGKVPDYENYVYAAAGYGPFINITAEDDDHYRKLIVNFSIKKEIKGLVMEGIRALKKFFSAFEFRHLINLPRTLEYILRDSSRLFVINVLVAMPKSVRDIFRKQLEHVFRVEMFDPDVNYYHKIGCFEEIIRLPKDSRLAVVYPKDRNDLYKILDSVREAGVYLIGFISDQGAKEDSFNYPFIDVRDLGRINPDYCAIFSDVRDPKLKRDVAQFCSNLKIINLESGKKLGTRTERLFFSVERRRET